MWIAGARFGLKETKVAAADLTKFSSIIILNFSSLAQEIYEDM